MGLIKELPVPGDNKEGWPWIQENDPDVYLEGNEWPKISIVIPSYNQGQFIEEAIRSILLQNYPHLELIIIDGGSTDKTAEILKAYSSWITYWVSEKDNGQSHAIAKGLNIVKGEVFNWINSDDSLTPMALYEVGKAFRENKIDVFCGRLNFVSEDNRFINVTHRFNSFNEAEAISCGQMSQPAMFYQTRVIREIGSINQSIKFSMDYELWIRYLLNCEYRNTLETDVILANFRYHGTSKSISEGYHSGFEKDNVSIFYSLAEIYGLKKEKKGFEMFLTSLTVQLNHSLYDIKKKSVLAAACNQVLFGYLVNLYVHNNKQMLRLYKCINFDLITERQKEQFKRMPASWLLLLVYIAKKIFRRKAY